MALFSGFRPRSTSSQFLPAAQNSLPGPPTFSNRGIGGKAACGRTCGRRRGRRGTWSPVIVRLVGRVEEPLLAIVGVGRGHAIEDHEAIGLQEHELPRGQRTFLGRSG